MAHFAKLDSTNKVISVEVLSNELLGSATGLEQEQVGVEFLTTLYGGGWYKQTSYNGSFRKNFAGTNYTYDSTRDAFIAPQPYNSFILNETTCRWENPAPYPTDDKRYAWDEEITNWKEVI
jgi:hypothetical protein